MRFFFSDTFDLDLPPGHRFPGEKYGLLRRKLLEDAILSQDMLVESPLAVAEDALLAHDKDYVEAFFNKSLDPEVERRIGLPCNDHLIKRTMATVGGAIAAVEEAANTGISGQLAGGTHHAHRGFGAGYCVFNDFAIATLRAIQDGWVRRVAIIDLDVHQGDGNAAILASHPGVFIMSIHGDKNFPYRKYPSDLDIALADGADDDIFMAALAGALPKVMAFKPDLVLYQAGVDALAEDRLGRLNLTHNGLMRRDDLVLWTCKSENVPVSMAIGGGYADPISASVEAYANTYRVAKSIYGF